MLKSDHYDLAALEAYRAVETALSRAFVDSDIEVRPHSLMNLIKIAADVGIIPSNIVSILHEVRIARNNAVHGTQPISKKQAQWIVDKTKEILGNIKVLREKEKEDTDSQQKNTPDSE